MTMTLTPIPVVKRRRSFKWRALVAVSLAAVAAVLAITLAFGSQNTTAGSSTGSATTGSVTIGNPTSTTCPIYNMQPGDSSTGYRPTPAGQTDPQTQPCSFSVTYSGNLPAYIGLGAATTGTGLYDGTGNGLQFQISDNHTSYTNSGAINTNSASSPLYVAADAGNDSVTYTFTVNYALPRISPSTYRGLNTTLTLTVYAVQSGGNGLSSACTAGSQCSGSNAPAWS